MKLDREKTLRIAGVACVAIGSTCLYIGGSTESQGAAIVGAVFALAAIIAAIVKPAKA